MRFDIILQTNFLSMVPQKWWIGVSQYLKYLKWKNSV